jgi:hypothetical protein
MAYKLCVCGHTWAQHSRYRVIHYDISTPKPTTTNETYVGVCTICDCSKFRPKGFVTTMSFEGDR